MTTVKDTTQSHRIHSQNFIVKNRKVSWQALYQNGELCIGERTVHQFLMEKDDEIEALKSDAIKWKSENLRIMEDNAVLTAKLQALSNELNRIKEGVAFMTQGARIITEYDHHENFTITPYDAYIIRKTSIDNLL